MDKLTQLTINASLRNMFDKGWVDICAIKECLKLAGITPMGRGFELLNALHCVHINKMERELAEAIPTLLEEAFNGVRFDMALVRLADVAPAPAAKPGFLARIGVTA